MPVPDVESVLRLVPAFSASSVRESGISRYTSALAFILPVPCVLLIRRLTGLDADGGSAPAIAAGMSWLSPRQRDPSVCRLQLHPAGAGPGVREKRTTKLSQLNVRAPTAGGFQTRRHRSCAPGPEDGHRWDRFLRT